MTGIDISPRAIAIAKEKAKKAGVHIRLRVGSGVQLPFHDEEFNFVHDMGCFHHILPEDRESYIKGIHRVLKNGGIFQATAFSL